MGRFWKEKDEVEDAAIALAHDFAGLANKEGVAYGPDARGALEGALLGHAADFMSLDPQKIIDEWDRMQKVSRDVNVDVSEPVTVALGATTEHLRGWYGAGADAFRDQVNKMRAFTGMQSDYIGATIQALGSMLRVAVQSRDDFVALAEATRGQIDKVFKDDADAGTQFLLKVGNGIVKAVLGVLEDPKKMAFAIIENALDVTVEGVTLVMEGGKLGEITSNYTKQRERLLQGYESELATVQGLIERGLNDVMREQPKLYDPLPLAVDVNSPDFRYAAFESKDMAPGQFSARVETERQKYVEEKQHKLVNSDSPIQQRLAGN
ncbi:hypothetical protein [Actinocrispum wychmicini]|uniref:Uncharacterized protein n=1 Tax=Actinocrispum wychmicini TaxID=1213861 RepID=A0A4V2S4G0_9PSEU|nr:hypothetical protein [Actinocrispum wychmicini]TCO48070.1 hypothetical protein EV192_116123 [Actinocrispum wychmicini]